MTGKPANSSWIALLCLLVAVPVMAEVEPPPEPVQLSKRERSSLIAIYEAMVAESEPLRIGDPESSVVERMGEPEGVLSVGDRKRLSYGPGTIVVSGGKVIDIRDVPAEWLAAPNRQAYDDYQRALGNVHYMGKWMSSDDSWLLYERTRIAQERKDQRVTKGRIESAKRKQQFARRKAPILDYRQNGQRISRQQLVVTGKITVVDFYADWCGPCKKIAPYLQNLASDPEVVVRKVDIVGWRSPVARQWNLRSIPNMRVFDRQGQPVGQPTHDFSEVIRQINVAKRQ